MKEVKDQIYKRSKADPCLYYIWRNGRLALMLSWVDDILAVGHLEDVKQIKKKICKVHLSAKVKVRCNSIWATKLKWYIRKMVGPKLRSLNLFWYRKFVMNSTCLEEKYLILRQFQDRC